MSIRLRNQLPTEGRDRGDSGFSLIETMIVVGIITLLVGLAYAVFVAATARAQDRAVQTNMRTAYSAVKVMSTDDGTYSTVSAAALAEEEQSLTFVSAAVASTTPEEVSVDVYETTPGGRLVGLTLASMSEGGDCFYMTDDITSGDVSYGIRAVESAGACRADDTTNVDWSGWGIDN